MDMERARRGISSRIRCAMMEKARGLEATADSILLPKCIYAGDVSIVHGISPVNRERDTSIRW